MTRTTKGWRACAVALLIAWPALAQETGGMPEMTPEQMAEMQAYMKAGTPGPQHAELAKAAGEYVLHVKSWPNPDAPPVEETASATRSMILDGRVLVEEMHGSMMGSPYEGRLTMGFDNVTGTYWSTWVDSMSTGMMVSHGTCDADGLCTMKGSWSDPVTGGTVNSRMTTRWREDGTQLFEMYGPGKDGGEVKMMEIVYERK